MTRRRSSECSKPAPRQPADEPEPLRICSGVFTEEQAERGKLVYTEICASCHGNTGRGGPSVPTLTGYTLNSKHEGVSLSTYFRFMRDTMPVGRPGSLQEQTYADVLAYLLKMHGAPAGDHELAVMDARFANITIEKKPK
ncbi:cytochrome c [Paracoccaceae bacterium Fryx2]|nr:cytochrome c [Paracoccaceae bacterium Fryx2]